MKLVVFGATGGTGSHVVQQACAAGHDVTAVVRNPASLVSGPPNLTVLRADPMDPTSIVPVVAGQDAVVSAIGSRDGRAPTTVCADSASAIVTAMRNTARGGSSWSATAACTSTRRTDR
jgi:putative NADH-flavin reductase